MGCVASKARAEIVLVQEDQDPEPSVRDIEAREREKEEEEQEIVRCATPSKTSVSKQGDERPIVEEIAQENEKGKDVWSTQIGKVSFFCL